MHASELSPQAAEGDAPAGIATNAKLYLSKFVPQPLVALVIGILAALCMITAWRIGPQLVLDAEASSSALIALFLGGAVIVAGLHPIHIQRNFKVEVATAPLYVAAILLSPITAALVAGGGTLILRLLTRAQRGNTPSDIVTAAGRWVIGGFVSACVAQQGINELWPLWLVLVGVAASMYLCDLVLGALEIAPMIGASPLHVVILFLREAALSEMAQYLIGILAALAALQQPWSLALWVLPLGFIYRSFKYAKEMDDGTSRLLESMADAVDLRDPYTGGHSRRVKQFALHILHELSITGPEVDLISSAAHVHDIGKIGIPDQILNKPGRLTAEEKQIMDSHPDQGAELLVRYHDFARGAAIVRHHHERWDGKGYPARLQGFDIPFGARVIAVADSFDAMTSDRPYRAGMTLDQAAAVLREGRGKQWEAAIVDALLRYLERQQP